MKRLLSILLVLCFFIPAHAETNSIIGCITSVTEAKSIGTTATVERTNDACAQFILFPESIFAGPGGDNPELSKFFHPALDTWSYDELWSVYGGIVQYLHDNSASIVADGYRLSSGETVEPTACITLYSAPYMFVSFYDLLTHQIDTAILLDS